MSRSQPEFGIDVKQQPMERATAGTLPPQLTRFIGRDQELAELAGLLADLGCRLLTLAGPGGIGKTRLAIEAARQMAGFDDGTFFVALQPVASPDLLVTAIADGVRCPLSGPEEPVEQLLHYLAGKRMLLLLDNFEHLLDGAGLLSDILVAAEQVKIVVTSREVLNLREEWVYPVRSLPFPRHGYSGDLELFGAVQLFAERARHARPDFSPAAEREAVARITELVEGMPLAIELAASWVNTLDCATIAAEIGEHVDFLTTSSRNMPSRHRSMRAAFEQSWRLLSDREREVFKRLSVFRGGFELEMARQVAGATHSAPSGQALQALSSLVAKSLVWRDSEGRYQLHELLRQFAEEELERSAEEVLATHEAHCNYFAAFMDRRAEAVLGPEQSVALAEIARDLENVRAAWRWACAHVRVEYIGQAARAMFYFCQFKSRYREGADAFEQAEQSLSGAPETAECAQALAFILVADGWMRIRLGQLDRAADVLERSRAIMERTGVAPLPGIGTDPLVPLSILATVRGDYAGALHLGEEALRRSRESGDKWNQEISWYAMSGAAVAMGNNEAARRYASESARANLDTGNRWFRAYSLVRQGEIARALADYDEARKHFEASYAIRKDLEDPEGMALAQGYLGEIALLEGDLAEGERLYRESFALYSEIGDQGGLSTALAGLGRVAGARDDYPEARERLVAALQTAARANIVPYTLDVLVSIGELLLKTGQYARAAELFGLVLAHPASNRETRDRAESLMLRCAGGLRPEALKEARGRGASAEMDAVVAALPEEFAVPRGSAPGAGAGSEAGAAAQPLVEPLTGRELEVLQYIAEGLSNREIADRMIISSGTVKWYVSQISSKLGAQNRTHAVAEARRLRLLP